MAASYIYIYVDDVLVANYRGEADTVTITSTGFTTGGGYTYTYSGSGTFAGFSTTSGATTPNTGMAVGDTYQLPLSQYYFYWYSVVAVTAATVTYGNTSVGTLTQLGQKMRIPSTTLTQDGFAYYLDDITIECNPASGNQVRCSYWDPYQSDYADIFATEDAVTQVLDVADQLALGPIMITYEEVPATTFTIDGTTYDVDANTAYWYDWVASNFAPSGSGIEMDPTSSTYFVHLGGTASNYGIFYSGNLQSPGDEIIIGRAYTTGAAYEQHDLTGTTWFFNSSLNYPFSSDNYSLNFTSNGVTYANLQLDDYSMYYSNSNVTVTAYGPQSGPPAWSNQNYRTISITGGADATNAALYAFISANATQTGNGLISFSIAGVTYCAESGMTWTQWVNSGYNTGNFAVYSASAKIPARIAYTSWEPGECVAVSSSTICAPTDTIVANTAYIKGNAATGPVISL